MLRIRLIALVGAVALLAAACGSSADSITESAEAPSASTAETVAPAPSASESTDPTTAEVAPDETGTAVAAEPVALVGGGQFDLGSLEGQDTVLWFWAPW